LKAINLSATTMDKEGDIRVHHGPRHATASRIYVGSGRFSRHTLINTRSGRVPWGEKKQSAAKFSTAQIILRQIFRLLCSDNSKKKYFDFNIVDYIYVNCGLSRSGARRCALAQTIGNARGLDINSLLSM
jgi:hypothetical protein